MLARRTIARLALFAVALNCTPQRNAQAGPLLDWLFGHRYTARPVYPVGQPVPVAPAGVGAAGFGAAGFGAAGAPLSGTAAVAMTQPTLPSYAGNYGNYYGSMMPVIGPSGYGYTAAQPSGITAATTPSIMSYVPDYRTSSYRAPVTYYRPIMTTDPNTGAQVVALAPCTSYEYQAQRIQTFGYNGLLGSFNTPPVQPAPQAMPTYTLPSGGVPLAANSPSVLTPSNGTYSTGYGSYAGNYAGGYTTAVPYSSGPSVLTPSYSSNYGNFLGTNAYANGYANNGYSTNAGSYSALQPALTAPPAGSYPTAPYGNTPGYYGSGVPSGGSSGSLAPTGLPPATTTTIYGPGQPYTPGLVAPQTPAYGQPVSPPTTAPGVYPPADGASSDPNANVPPTLPPVGFPLPGSGAQLNRPQLRSIVRQPLGGESTYNPQSASNQRSEQSSSSNRNSPAPQMTPIEAPAEMQSQPRWNPGLLSEKDRTAMRPTTAPHDLAYAGQAKPIHWASFTEQGAASEPSRSGLRAIAPESTSSSSPVLGFSNDARSNATRSADERITLEFSSPTPAYSPASEPSRAQSSTAQPMRSTSGWKAAR